MKDRLSYRHQRGEGKGDPHRQADDEGVLHRTYDEAGFHRRNEEDDFVVSLMKMLPRLRKYLTIPLGKFICIV